MLCLLLGIWALGCGGRYEQIVEGDDTTSGGTASGGRGSGQAGGSSRAGSASRAGAASGGSVGVAGSAATMGGSPGCFCDPIACAPPFREVPDAGGCCYHCELDLMQCEQQSADYRLLRQQMIDKYNSLGCASDTDCALYYAQNQCGVASCAFTLLASTLKEVDQNLQSYAQTNCSAACPGASELPCPPPTPPRCVMRRCQ